MGKYNVQILRLGNGLLGANLTGFYVQYVSVAWSDFGEYFYLLSRIECYSHPSATPQH